MDEFSNEDIKNYDTQIRPLLANIVGSLAVVAALDKDTFDRLHGMSRELFALDETVGRISAQYAKERAATVIKLSSTFEIVFEYHDKLIETAAQLSPRPQPSRWQRLRDWFRRRRE